MKKLVSSLALIMIPWSAMAATATGQFSAEITLVPACRVTVQNNPSATFTAFQAITASQKGRFQVECTEGLSSTVSVKHSMTNAAVPTTGAPVQFTDQALNLNYFITVAADSSTPVINGTAYEVNVLPSGGTNNVGQCAAGSPNPTSCSNSSSSNKLFVVSVEY